MAGAPRRGSGDDLDDVDTLLVDLDPDAPAAEGEGSENELEIFGALLTGLAGRDDVDDALPHQVVGDHRRDQLRRLVGRDRDGHAGRRAR